MMEIIIRGVKDNVHPLPAMRTIIHCCNILDSKEGEKAMGKTEVKKEHEKPDGGNPLVIDIEIDGQIIQIEIACQGCGCKLFWMSEDHALMYCSKCRGVIGRRFGDFVMPDKIQWKV